MISRASPRAAAPTDSHSFVVPAFGDSPWLERCLDSLERQTVRSEVVITTSTPSERIESIAARRSIRLVVNAVSAGIASDWNFGLAQGRTDWLTLAHQDDWYEPDYAEACLGAAAAIAEPLLVFTSAMERIEGRSDAVMNSRVKRAICAMIFLANRSIDRRLRKRLLLSFGNPIPCPSVMFNRRALAAFRFPEGWKSNLDWRAWLTLADRAGAFVYVPRPLVHRTLHAAATTTTALDDRGREDDLIFHQLWPSPIAVALSWMYSASRLTYKKLRHG